MWNWKYPQEEPNEKKCIYSNLLRSWYKHNLLSAPRYVSEWFVICEMFSVPGSEWLGIILRFRGFYSIFLVVYMPHSVQEHGKTPEITFRNKKIAHLSRSCDLLHPWRVTFFPLKCCDFSSPFWGFEDQAPGLGSVVRNDDDRVRPQELGFVKRPLPNGL